MTAKKKLEIKNIIINVAVTFFEAAIAVWFASGMQSDKIAIGAAIGAGVSAVWNIVLKPFLKNYGWIK
jgi:hypothetical protein